MSILKSKIVDKAFSLMEVMMALVVVSVMLAVMAPVLITKKPESEKTNIEVVDTTPVGVIVAWYGHTYPAGWLPLDGQPIEEPKYEALRRALDGRTNLPNLNVNVDPENFLVWIIKAEKR